MDKFKEKFYLWGAAYFAFWAKITLRLWRPRVIVVSGSSGKTTVFYLLAAQLEGKARFAYDANSAYGIAFDILGLKRQTYSWLEWLKLVLLAPVSWWPGQRPPLYVVEADAERPGEAAFTQRLLRPDYVVITNVYQTHAKFFDKVVAAGKAASPLVAIGDEFVKFMRVATGKSLINADSPALMQAIERANFPKNVRDKIVYLQEADYLREYKIYSDSTQFVINKKRYTFPYFLPKSIAFGLQVVQIICSDLGVMVDPTFAKYYLPPGRSSILRGIRGTTLIDSTYNANLGSATAMLTAFDQYPAPHKWVVLGEFRDQGQESKKQHEALTERLLDLTSVERAVLISPELREWVYPRLVRWWGEQRVVAFDDAADAYAWLLANIAGGETILLKGSQGRHLEGIVEGLLADPADAVQLSCRHPLYRAEQERIMRAGAPAGESAPPAGENTV